MFAYLVLNIPFNEKLATTQMIYYSLYYRQQLQKICYFIVFTELGNSVSESRRFSKNLLPLSAFLSNFSSLIVCATDLVSKGIE